MSGYRRAPDVSRLRSDRPDVILMDIIGCNGIEKAREVAAQLPDCKILFLSAYEHPAIIGAASSAGGHGYLVKPVAIQDLQDAIRRAARGLTPPDLLESGQIIGDQPLRERIRRLTPREIEIVH